MNHLIIEFVINILIYIFLSYIYISAPVSLDNSRSTRVFNLKIFFLSRKCIYSESIPHMERKKKKNLLLSVKFKTEEARVNLSDLLPCMVFYMGSIKGEFSPDFSSYIEEIVESFSWKFFILSSGSTTHYGAKKEGMWPSC